MRRTEVPTHRGFTRRYHRRRAHVAAVALVPFVIACQAETAIVVQAEFAGGDPVPDLGVMALPFDPAQLLDSLRAVAPWPKPDFGDLEAELREYERPDNAQYAELNLPWLALRDTVVALSDSLMAMDRSEPGYATRYARFRQLYARLAERASERDRALRDVAGEDVALARRAASAADSLRAWEYEAFASYGELAAAAVIRAERGVAEGETDNAGMLELEIEPGRWWLVARRPDPNNPFMEYFWSVPVTATRVVPVRVPLTPQNAQWRWRH
jgi:hypothetical protein